MTGFCSEWTGSTATAVLCRNALILWRCRAPFGGCATATSLCATWLARDQLSGTLVAVDARSGHERPGRDVVASAGITVPFAPRRSFPGDGQFELRPQIDQICRGAEVRDYRARVSDSATTAEMAADAARRSRRSESDSPAAGVVATATLSGYVRLKASRSRIRSNRTLLPLTIVLVVGVLSGCSVPSQPSPADWRSAARQALEDSASEVESVALVLRLDGEDQVFATSARVAAVESEESLAKAVDSVQTQQPPASLVQEDSDVSDLLGRATDLVREARIAATARDTASYDDLRERLLALSDDLDSQREELE